MRKVPAIVPGTLFFWAGFVSSISFLEAWLKFRAPGVTLPVGLSIGKLVFNTMNRLEWIFLVLLTIAAVKVIKDLPKYFIYGFGIIAILLISQTFLLLPELTERAEMIVAGNTPGESYAHWLFGIAEVLKVILLAGLGNLSVNFQISSKPKL